ncbi:MAG: NADPH-dependent 7-cyano-7-deazaguanine reductase [Chloroflexi bacterium]|nr:NADPH-dependent 7-cyano-7-deazaguanine reductase [Chloroflexota bacterium]
MTDYSALGKPVTKFEKLDPIPTACKYVEYHSDQLISACPVTGQPDFYEALIQLEADGVAIETKTLKLYLETYQQRAIFCEDLTVKICEDIFNACRPRKCTVTLVQRRRGGIQITARHDISQGESF